MAKASTNDPATTGSRDLIEKAFAEAAELADGARTLAAPSHAIPGYRVLREIHRGGQGVVFEAVQESVGRTVAVKIIHGSGGDTRDLGRFEREVHVLSQLKHPNIVTIHDSGRTDGHLYLIMDRVAGVPLDAWVADLDRRPASLSVPNQAPGCLRNLLRAFMKICDAVHAAHVRGVIHRDLKPSNILIDAAGEPHVLDFGLAKILNGECDDHLEESEITLTGQFVGSLPWASPEQAEGRPDKVDTRTDVYSLGVILYRILTGRFPYAVTGASRLILDTILTAEPIRPSTMCRWVDDELETVILKCLCKDPVRRYQSAAELSRDIDHYLAGEPIEAKRDSPVAGWYLVKKILERYRFYVAAALAGFLVLLAFGVTMAVMYGHLQTANERELTEKRRARETSDVLRRVITADYLRKLVQGKPPDPAREILDDLSGQIAAHDYEPVVKAELLGAFGSAYMAVGLYREAEPPLREALRIREELSERGSAPEDDMPAVAASQNDLAECLRWQAKYQAALEMHERSLQLRRSLLRPPDPDIATSLHNLAATYYELGRYETARGYYEQALEMRQAVLDGDDPATAKTMNHLGACLTKEGKYADAEVLYQQAEGILRRALGDRHSEVAASLGHLGWCLTLQRRFEEAEPVLGQAYEMLRKVGGDGHPHVERALNNWATCLVELGEYPRAEPLLNEALRRKRDHLSPNDPSIGKTLCALGMLHYGAGRLGEAERFCREALDIQANLPLARSDAAESRRLLARILMDLDRPAEAEPLLREALEIQEQAEPPIPWEIAKVRSLLGRCLLALGVHEGAEDELLSAYSVLRDQFGDSDRLTQETRSDLCALYRQMGNGIDASEFCDD